MANRNLLHLSKVKEFRDWMESQGWVAVETKGLYEVLRLVKPKEQPIILYQRNGCDHASVLDKDFEHIRQFIRATRKDV